MSFLKKTFLLIIILFLFLNCPAPLDALFINQSDRDLKIELFDYNDKIYEDFKLGPSQSKEKNINSLRKIRIKDASGNFLFEKTDLNSSSLNLYEYKDPKTYNVTLIVTDTDIVVYLPEK